MTRKATAADYAKRRPQRISRIELRGRFNLKRSRGTKNGTNY